jgi:hypothetical protein
MTLVMQTLATHYKIHIEVVKRANPNRAPMVKRYADYPLSNGYIKSLTDFIDMNKDVIEHYQNMANAEHSRRDR